MKNLIRADLESDTSMETNGDKRKDPNELSGNSNSSKGQTDPVEMSIITEEEESDKEIETALGSELETTLGPDPDQWSFDEEL